MVDDNEQPQKPDWMGGLDAIVSKLAEAEQQIKNKLNAAPESEEPQPDMNTIQPLGDWIETGVGEPVSPEEAQQIIFGINLIEAKDAPEGQIVVQTKPTIPSAPVRCSCLGCRDRRKKQHRAAELAQQLAAKEEHRRQQESKPTCKFYAPPGVHNGNLPKGFPFNRAAPQIGLCGSELIAGPAKWKAFAGCGMTDNQSTCPGYQPDTWDVLSQSEVTAADGAVKVVAVRRSRFGVSTRHVYEVILQDTEETNVLHRVDSYDHGDDSQNTTEQLFAMEIANFEATGFSTKEKPVELEKNPSYLTTVTVE